jgi:rhodanese-related sulfurtransferase
MSNETSGRLTVGSFLATARAGLDRVTGDQLEQIRGEGGRVIDIRNDHTRLPEGHIPGSVVIDRLVLEWRLDPSSGAVMDDAPDFDDVIVIVCNEGYSSSIAAKDLQRLGFRRATDLIGGFRQYAADGHPVVRDPLRVVR